MKSLTKSKIWFFAIGQFGWSLLSGIISITALNTDFQTFKRIDKEVVSIQTGNQFIRRLLRRYLLVLYDLKNVLNIYIYYFVSMFHICY